MKDKNSHQYSKKLKENNQNNKARVQVTLNVEKKPQALSTPSDFSEYTIKKLSRLQDSAIRSMAFTKFPQC